MLNNNKKKRKLCETSQAANKEAEWSKFNAFLIPCFDEKNFQNYGIKMRREVIYVSLNSIEPKL